MEEYISVLEKAVETLNSNVSELQLTLRRMNIKVMELKGKVLTGDLKTDIGRSRFMADPNYIRPCCIKAEKGK